METEVVDGKRSSFRTWDAIRVITTTVGVLFGFCGMNHGIFECLQGNTPTGGMLIHAIGEAQRFWPEGTEDAFTIAPTFLASGLLSMALGLTIVVWSLRFIRSRHGRTVFLLLFVALFLVGGGIGQLAFFLPAWAFATRMGKPLTWWRRVLPRKSWPFLSRLWIVLLIVSVVVTLMGVEAAVFGIVPGMTDPGRIQSTAMGLVFGSAVLNVIAYVAGFGHELRRMEEKGEEG